jgi:class 3 adenylate cyclase
LELHSTLKVKQTADLAVYSFMKIIAEITRAPGLQKYKENAKLKNRIKGYEGVKMGFGLHVGWAIEGPIGSEFKIDASYLGPHVNVAGSLEGATKSYGVPMLISGDVYKLLTGKYKDNLRQVDKVKMKKKE